MGYGFEFTLADFFITFSDASPLANAFKPSAFRFV
jgi:hypothetical protein